MKNTGENSENKRKNQILGIFKKKANGMTGEDVRPTRMELLNTKQKLIMAKKGHSLLKQKRDALVLEFFNKLSKVKDLRAQVNRQTIYAHSKLANAQGMHSQEFIENLASVTLENGSVEVKTKNIMGVRIPSIVEHEYKRTITQRDYSILATSSQLDEAVGSFEQTLEYSIKLAETETALKRLLKEIQKTNRRVNALEYKIQPELQATIREITEHLNRLEAERFFALKLTKKRIQATSQR